AFQDVAIDHLYFEPVANLNLKRHPGNNLVVHEVVDALGIYEDGDRLLLEETLSLHRLQVLVVGKSMNHTIGRL
ncbi:hypothetical protein GW17_00057608, partial [Ensete ventricosum]